MPHYATTETSFLTLAQKRAREEAVMFMMGVPMRPVDELDMKAFIDIEEECLIGFPSDDVVLVYFPAHQKLSERWEGESREWVLEERIMG